MFQIFFACFLQMCRLDSLHDFSESVKNRPKMTKNTKNKIKKNPKKCEKIAHGLNLVSPKSAFFGFFETGFFFQITTAFIIRT